MRCQRATHIPPARQCQLHCFDAESARIDVPPVPVAEFRLMRPLRQTEQTEGFQGATDAVHTLSHRLKKFNAALLANHISVSAPVSAASVKWAFARRSLHLPSFFHRHMLTRVLQRAADGVPVPSSSAHLISHPRRLLRSDADLTSGELASLHSAWLTRHVSLFCLDATLQLQYCTANTRSTAS